jgi:choline kinase
LQNYIHSSDTVKIIFNPHFANYGSNYSLYLGLLEAVNEQCNEIVFAEGDLIIDKKSFIEICEANENIITATYDLICADKSVVFYLNDKGEVKYIYDTEHKQLSIDEPFTLLANSGQIWKFNRCDILQNVLQVQSENDFKGTNLTLIQEYFRQTNYKVQIIKKWHNCNTVQDYRKAMQELSL